MLLLMLLSGIRLHREGSRRTSRLAPLDRVGGSVSCARRHRWDGREWRRSVRSARGVRAREEARPLKRRHRGRVWRSCQARRQRRRNTRWFEPCLPFESMSVHVSGCASGVLSGEARQVAPAKTLTLPPALPRLTRTARDGPTVAARWERSVDQGNARGKGHIEGRWGERIVGLEGARTTPAFLQRHGHARLELIRLLSPEYEGRLPARAGEPTGIRPFPPCAVEDHRPAGPLRRVRPRVGALPRQLPTLRRPRPEGIRIRRGEKIR
jgi:hypothetical protein